MSAGNAVESPSARVARRVLDAIPMRWFFFSFLFAIAAAPSPRAFACGGFFCSTSPIDQSREVVVYGHEADGSLTMAVQVNYTGMDEDFAWILPVPVPPDDISIAPDSLFSQLEAATAPVLNLQRETTGRCQHASCSYPSYGCSGFGCGASDSVGPPEPGYSDAGGGVIVHSERVVGPYDTVVLGAATAAEVIRWLGDNAYDIPAESEPLLEPYAAQGFVFIALRLNANRNSNVVRPIVLHMATTEACLPIRLTAIATTPDLPIALFFLGDAQARSTNYSYVDPSSDPELWMYRRTWDDAVAEQVRALGGHAFSTDYAGSTPRLTLETQRVTDLGGAGSPGELLSGLLDRGYVGTALLLELFERFIVPPSGTDSRTYYNCLASGGDASDCGGEPRSFDPAGLVRAIDEEIVAPNREAQALVDRHAMTTRLSTRMRAEDMTIDPVFELDPDLPDVPRERSATLTTRCAAEYFEAGAPQDLLVNGEMMSVRAGEIIDEDEACLRMGGVRDEGGCSAAVSSQASTFVIVTMLGFFAIAIYRRRR